MTATDKPRARLVGLPGTTGDVSGVRVGSVTAAVRELRAGEAVFAAGDDGAITVWKDDAGMLRCEFSRRMWTVDAKSFKYLAAVHQWLKDWWPKMRR